MDNAPQLLRRLFDTAVEACHPVRVVARALPPRPAGRVIVVGAGKAAAAMAAAVEDAWGPPLSGLVVTRYGHGQATRFIEVLEAGHPYPDDAGSAAAARLLDAVRGLSAGDFVLALLSGGGSALTGLPLAPLTLEEKQAITKALIRSSASIREINCVRKHLSAIKGGRLAAAAFPAPLLALAISDVPGDDASVIASGLTVGDRTTQAEARAILSRYGVEVPAHAASVLNDPAFESVKPDDPRLRASSMKIIAKGADGIAAAADEAQRLGWEVQVLGLSVEGDARDVARAHAEIALNTPTRGRPLVLLSGGELTLTVSGTGRGGRNREYALALARALNGAPGIWALAADTDGIDGSDDAAGAWIDPGTLARARTLGLDPAVFQSRSDSGGFFAALNQAVVTGPTRTNVNDFRTILIAPGV